MRPVGAERQLVAIIGGRIARSQLANPVIEESPFFGHTIFRPSVSFSYHTLYVVLIPYLGPRYQS